MHARPRVIFAALGVAAWLAFRAAETRTSPPSPVEQVPLTWTDARDAPMHRRHVGTEKIACTECHERTDQKPGEGVCAKCHAPQDKTHHQGKAPKTTSCLSCHAFGLTKPAECKDCHSPKHHVESACTSCHQPHRPGPAVSAESTTCHEDKHSKHEE